LWILAQLGNLENRVYFLPGHPFLAARVFREHGVRLVYSAFCVWE
jgi:hypothetical protein